MANAKGKEEVRSKKGRDEYCGINARRKCEDALPELLCARRLDMKTTLPANASTICLTWVASSPLPSLPISTVPLSSSTSSRAIQHATVNSFSHSLSW